MSASQGEIRRRNRTRVLQLIANGRGLESRASIARRTGLTSATVSSIVADLIEEGFAEDGGLAESTGGKPATMVRADRQRHLVGAITVDLHRARSALLDLTGELTAAEPKSYPPVRSGEAILAILRELERDAGGRLLATGIVVPGAVAGEVVHESVQLGLREVDLGGLARGISAPFHLINDADAAALEEYSMRSSRPRSQLLISLGHGTGAGLILDGELHHGDSARVGEIGHVRSDLSPAAPRCRCGRRGCLERLTAIPYLLDLADDADLETTDIAALAAAPEHAAAIDRAARALSSAILMTCAAIDVPHVVLGGSAPRLGSGFIERVRRYCHEGHPVGASRVEIEYAVATPLDHFRGAAEHALRQQLGIHWG